MTKENLILSELKQKISDEIKQSNGKITSKKLTFSFFFKGSSSQKKNYVENCLRKLFLPVT